MSDEKFNGDRIEGEAAEKEAQAWLFQKIVGAQFFIPVSEQNRRHYDFTLVAQNIPILFEVKFDKENEQTGNVAVEEMCSDKPSGVTASWSDYVVYKLVKAEVPEFYLIPTGRLRMALIGLDGRRTKGGDGNRADLKLFKADVFKAQCDCRLDEVDDGSIVLVKYDKRLVPLKP